MSNFSLTYLTESFFTLITLNVFVYTILLFFFFTVFFLFDFRIFRTLSEYKFFKTSGFFNTTLIVIFFSLAGVPPFLGFFSKFLLFAGVFISSNFFLFVFFIFLNLFFIFFYIQNVRFLFSKTNKNIYIYQQFKVYLNFSLISFLTFMNFVNVSAALIFEYILIFLFEIGINISIF